LHGRQYISRYEKEADMAISIRNPRAEELAREAAREAGEYMMDAIIHALEERLARLRGRRLHRDLADQVLDIAGRCSALPDLDTRSAEEITGYGSTGAAHTRRIMP
jgi:antitoxin VapB